MELEQFVSEKTKRLAQKKVERARIDGQIEKLQAEIDNAEAAHEAYLKKRAKNRGEKSPEKKNEEKTSSGWGE